MEIPFIGDRVHLEADVSHVESSPPMAANRDSVWLATVCQLLGCLLLAGWAAWRVKPVFWFGPVFGVILGILSLMMQQWLSVQSMRRSVIEVAMFSGLGVAVTFSISAVRSHAAMAAQSPRDQLAGSLIAALEQTTTTDPSAPDVSTLKNPATVSFPRQVADWLALRYRPRSQLAWWLAGGEVASAGLLGAVVLWGGSRLTETRRRGSAAMSGPEEHSR